MKFNKLLIASIATSSLVFACFGPGCVESIQKPTTSNGVDTYKVKYRYNYAPNGATREIKTVNPNDYQALKNKVNQRNEHFRREVHTNEANIAKNKQAIKKNKKYSRKNRKMIKHNRTAIKQNRRALDVLDSRVTGNSKQINKNSKRITKNSDRIQKNKKYSRKNRKMIKKNKRNIERNYHSIQNNSAALAALSSRTDHLERRIGMTEDFALASSAGSSAMAVVDFGNVKKGQTQVGVGAGYAHGRFADGSASAWAGAVGMKHGITDDTALVIKGWYGEHNAYGGGVGIVTTLP